MEMARKVEGSFICLEEDSITEEKLKKCLPVNKMKNKNAAGTDGIKAELCKEFAKRSMLTEVLVENF